MLAVRIVGLMLLGGLFEIGGGFLVWRWLREGSPLWTGLSGLAVLGLYGVVVTWQPLPFGRAYAAYGGVFVVLSILWALALDGFRPDRWDLAGAAVILSGVVVMVFGPRG
jgi:small multidrug resistance family-3 protein